MSRDLFNCASYLQFQLATRPITPSTVTLISARILRNLKMTRPEMSSSTRPNLVLSTDATREQNRRHGAELCRSASSPDVVPLSLEGVHHIVKKHIRIPDMFGCGPKSKMSLATASLMIPHPAKSSTNGEDALFATPTNIGIYDGVGGNNEHGVDPGPYARNMARLTKKYSLENPGTCPMKGAQFAARRNYLMGSCTVCHVALRRGRLETVNVGDSGFSVFRDGKEVYTSTDTLHAFNSPYQVSFHDKKDLDSRKVLKIKIKEGDIVVFGTDGLWDNLFFDEIESAVKRHDIRVKKRSENGTIAVGRRAAESKEYSLLERTALKIRVLFGNESGKHMSEDEEWNKRTKSLKKVAEELGGKACEVAASYTKRSPFGEKAGQHGHRHHGGKMDDISIIVALVHSSQYRSCSMSFRAEYP